MKMQQVLGTIAIAAGLTAGLAATSPVARAVEPLQSKQAKASQRLEGMASWYGPGFHGRKTANGERFDSQALTAAHRSLPFGTRVRVTNLNNGRSVTVRINDRGPFVGNRIIDLSAGAARSIGMIQSGVARVRLDILGK